MKKTLLAFGLALVAATIILSGCVQEAPEPKSCRYSTECDSALQDCVAGKCQLKAGLCDSNSLCARGDYCEPARNKCEFDCSACYDYQYCGQADRNCFGLKPERCLSDGDCPGGLRCDIYNWCS